MINVTLQNMLDSMPVFQNLIGQKLTARGAFKVSKLVKAINKEYEIFDETRRTIVEKYASRDEAGEIQTNEDGNVQIKKELEQDFITELQNLLQTELELNTPKLTFAEIENCEFTPAQVEILENFIEDAE